MKRVRLDSRAVEPGDLFVAVRGGQFDGMKFANEALARGATGVVADVDAQPPATGAWLVAERPRQVAALLAARAFGDPSHRLDVIGVTGTNGKTTTTFLLRSIFAAAGRRPAVLGTLGAFLPGREHPQERTTPEAPELQASLLAAAEAGADVVAMEVSSHA
ncbi:MAG: UDP-N-acetylmuramoyl-L-alanyl-D-glutamate--2,6-diaminopimelate ligase, partial [Gemmatimonadetes bacterium]|nr:UDP-N-acetylmuramoyl-L-alanyl-D-glutamate--2,6-diaminopimelate ligase [Gemmatimonadota bacterium]